MSRVYWDCLYEGKSVHLLGLRPRLGWPQYGKIALCGLEIESTEPNNWAKIGYTMTSRITCDKCRELRGLNAAAGAG